MSFQQILTFVENTSESPTNDLDTVLTNTVITPGGLDPNDNITTLGRLSQGSNVTKFVVAIEGCAHLLSDAPSASVLSAWAGHDSTSVLGGLFVELQNSQSISPDNPFPVGGRCTLRVIDTTGSDTFGIYVNKRNAGEKTTLTATADRNDTTLTVARGTDVSSGRDLWIGTECIYVSPGGEDVSSLSGVQRGRYAAFGCDSTGSGGARFARHHRVSTDPNTTLANPAITSVPRSWIGKGVSIYLHTWNEETQALNVKAQAQLIYAGRIAGIADDPDSMATILDVEHIAGDFQRGVVGRDLWAADITQGLYLRAGRRFKFFDLISDASPALAQATDLVVVTAGASGAYEINQGYYSGDEICAILSRWLAQAKTDGDIDGYYSWAYAVTSNVGLRTKCYWRIEAASTYDVQWQLGMPGEVAAFLGMGSDEDSPLGQTVIIKESGSASNNNRIKQGDFVPYASMVFRPFGPGKHGASFVDYGIVYELENERGTFWDNRAYLPASLKESCPDTAEWGLFLLDEKVLCVASYTYTAGPPYVATLRNVFVAPFQLAGDNDSKAGRYFGRRVDEDGAPITIRQVPIIEGPFKTLVNWLVYSTGTAGYNHGTYDVLPHGMGIGIPGSLLGPEWERSLANLPGADSPIAVVIDEPTKFADLLRDDFLLRRAFIRWHDQGFEFGTWRTPLVALAEHTLTEANKAGPAGEDENHRIASQETDQWHWPVVSIDYARDYGTGRNAQYLKSISLEDQAGSDGAGNSGRKLNLRMRNTFAANAAAGAAVEELIKEYLAGLPMFSRPSRMVVRSIDLRYFEKIAVGDICTIADEFARDPLTGLRGISSRAGIVTRITYNLGGPTPTGSIRPMMGELELFFLDTMRGGIYSPAADVAETVNYSGFSAGYNNATAQLWLHRQTYAMGVTINTKRGPITFTTERDAASFPVGSKITIVEKDPANTASPNTWTRTITAKDSDVITLSSALSAPSWDATKQYRVFSQPYADATAAQQDYVFQADSADEMIVDTEIADQYSATNVDVTFGASTFTTDKAEFAADLTWGDGKPLDVGTDAALAKTANAFIDYRTKHQQPFLFSESAPISAATGGADFDSAAFTLFAGIYHFGFDHLSTAVTRSVTVAPFFRMGTLGAVGKLRVSLCRIRPQVNPSAEEGDGVTGGDFGDPLYAAEVVQSAVWETTSTTYSVGADATLSIGVKDLHWGMCWIVVEGAREVQCRGLAKIVEGPRSTS